MRKPDVTHDIRKILIKEEYKAERFIAIFRAVFFGLCALESAAVEVLGLGAGFGAFLSPMAAIFGFSLLMMADVLAIGRKRLFHFFNWIYKYAAITLDVVILAVFDREMLSLVRIDPATALTLVALCTSVILIAVCAFRYSPRSCLYAGALSLVAFLALGLLGGYYRDLGEFFVRDGGYNLTSMLFVWPIVTISALTAVFARGVRNMLIRSKHQDMLSRFLPEIIVEDVMNGDREMELDGRTTEATILFSDIRNFTGYSEHRDPREVIDFLNSYFKDMIGVLFRYHGTLDKIMGDGIMAIFGAPFDSETHADDAVKTAIDMHRRLAEFNRARVARGEGETRIGIGIHTGPVVMGKIGVERRMEFAVIGDTVNTASRLETLTKDFHELIIISDATRRRLTGSYPIEALDSVTIRGHSSPMAIHSVAVPS